MTALPGPPARPAAATPIGPPRAARALGRKAAVCWAGLIPVLLLAAPEGALGLVLQWLLVGAIGALPWFGRTPAWALCVLAAVYIGLMGTIALSALGLLLELAPVRYCSLLLLPLGAVLVAWWILIALLLTSEPLAEWRVEVARVLTIASPPAGPLAGAGALLAGELGLRATTAGLWPTLWVAPELGGALTGLGVCLVGALAVRRSCAAQAPVDSPEG